MRPLLTAILVVAANDLLLAAFVLPDGGEIGLVGFVALALLAPLYALVSRSSGDDPVSRSEEDASPPGRQSRLGEFCRP